ncbi:2-aminoadipate transaminase [compost metagenome]
MEEELAGSGWEWTAPEGGLNLWIKLPESVSAAALFERSMEQSISFVPGELCDPLGEMTSWLRLSYSFASENVLREGMRKLMQLAREL